MKTIFLFLSFLILNASLWAQNYDDVYYRPGDEQYDHPKSSEATEPANKSEEETYYTDPDDYDLSDGYYQDNYTDTSRDEKGNTYITNNYYGDYNDYSDDYEYSTRLRRYYQPCSGYGYYSPCYTRVYYYDGPYYYGYYDPWYGYSGSYYSSYYYGSGFSVSIGYGYSYPSYYWYSCPGYGGWHHPYGGYYNNYWYGYYDGYNHGYYHGYYDGYYNSGYYYGSASSGNYYYGPRRSSSGISSYRNSSGSGKTSYSGSGKTSGNNISNTTSPVRANENNVKPIPTERVTEKEVKTINERPSIDQYTKDPRLEKANQPEKGKITEIKTIDRNIESEPKNNPATQPSRTNPSNILEKEITPSRNMAPEGNKTIERQNQIPQRPDVNQIPPSQKPVTKPIYSEPNRNLEPQRHIPSPSENQPRNNPSAPNRQAPGPAPKPDYNPAPKSQPEPNRNYEPQMRNYSPPKNNERSTPSRNVQPRTRNYTPERNSNPRNFDASPGTNSSPSPAPSRPGSFDRAPSNNSAPVQRSGGNRSFRNDN